jgi:hypothetical protein
MLSTVSAETPGLGPMDFLLWGYARTGSMEKLNGVIELRHRIEQAVASIALDRNHSTWSEISYRLDILRATRSALYKNFLSYFIHCSKPFNNMCSNKIFIKLHFQVNNLQTPCMLKNIKSDATATFLPDFHPSD